MNFFAAVGTERRRIERLVRDIKPGVILCHFGFMALRMLPVARRLRIPTVAHFHGLDLSSALNNRWYRWSLLRALKEFQAIIVVGSHQKRWVIEQGADPERVFLIPCGVPTGQFKPGRPGPSGGARFVTVCRLDEAKGVDHSIRAFAKVAERFADARLQVVGDGPLRERLEALAGRLGLNDSVTFTGPVAPEQVRNILAESDIYVQHSIVSPRGSTEGFGVAIAEASSCGLPVVATRCGGIEDQLVDGQTGYCVQQKDIEAMAQRMAELAADRGLRERLGAAGRKRMVEMYDSARQAGKLEEVLLGCVDEHRGK
jgi:glycosyltransferase involved in cell wall biosynthesis